MIQSGAGGRAALAETYAQVPATHEKNSGKHYGTLLRVSSLLDPFGASLGVYLESGTPSARDAYIKSYLHMQVSCVYKLRVCASELRKVRVS